MSYMDPDTGELVVGLKKVNYTHDACIDWLIANPGGTQGELARLFGYSEAWVSTILNSDAFQAALQERRREITDPHLIKTVNERLRAVADLSLQRVLQKLELPAGMINDEFLLNSAKLATSALGYGAKGPSGPMQVGVVIQMPGVAPDGASWAARYAKDNLAVVEEVEPVRAALETDHELPIRIRAAP